MIVVGLLWSVSPLAAQQIICINGVCRQVFPPVGSITLDPLQEEVLIDAEQLAGYLPTSDEDRFDQVIRATVRVTVSGVCGSGTVVGRDSAGNAIVLTNAHVAGTSRGRTVQLERWDISGDSERGQGTIIASGYGRGMSVDFALLRCSGNFATNVTPIPLANRYPDPSALITTYGCPRCEWPSLQVLKLNRREGQILSWKPQAIGGRSGSSVIDYTADGPRVVGLLTWGGGGEGLGQSTPFLLTAMKGQLPQTLESLPAGAQEVAAWESPQDSTLLGIYQVPATTAGEPAQRSLPTQVTSDKPVIDGDVLDSITEEGLRNRQRPKPEDDESGLRDRESRPVIRFLEWLRRATVTLVLCAATGALGFVVGRFWKIF
jgi:hypothetical protein